MTELSLHFPQCAHLGPIWLTQELITKKAKKHNEWRPALQINLDRPLDVVSVAKAIAAVTVVWPSITYDTIGRQSQQPIGPTEEFFLYLLSGYTMVMPVREQTRNRWEIRTLFDPLEAPRKKRRRASYFPPSEPEERWRETIYDRLKHYCLGIRTPAGERFFYPPPSHCVSGGSNHDELKENIQIKGRESFGFVRLPNHDHYLDGNEAWVLHPHRIKLPKDWV